MKISALISNLATNCIVRSWPILKVLERHHEVEVIGSLIDQQELFPPYAHEFSYKVVKWEKPGDIFRNLKKVREKITGDVVYAFKPLTTSFGVALLEKLHHRAPVILDIEDWETWGLYRQESKVKHAVRVTRHLIGAGWTHPHSEKYRYLTEQLTSFADTKTVVSSFLQHRYGGIILRHGPDTTVFDPSRFDKKALRNKWGINQEVRLLLFTGTPGKHKGLDDLISALDHVSIPQVRLLMAGRDTLPAPLAEKVLHLGFQPHSVMPELLAMADLVVLPQQRHPVAEAQIPAKVFEAMAMAKPVIASAISDLPEILSGCGVLVEPENVEALAAAIETVLKDRHTADEMGWRGREKCEREYSWNAMEAVLEQVLSPFARTSRAS